MKYRLRLPNILIILNESNELIDTTNVNLINVAVISLKPNANNRSFTESLVSITNT